MNPQLFLTQLAERGTFGPCDRLLSVNRVTKTKAPQFQSVIDFFSITLETHGLPPVTLSVVVKTPNPNWNTQDWKWMTEVNTIYFKNEIRAFKEILPILNAENTGLFGRLYEGMFYADPERLSENFLVFEDLSLENRLAPFEVFLDFSHLCTAVRALGRFHGLSYLKKKSCVDFNEYSFKMADISMEVAQKYNVFVTAGVARAIGGIEKDLANRLLGNTHKLSAFNEPEEPFSVIVHGDFNKNNLFFKYDQENHPIGVKMFDLQMCCYADPVQDLGFILYLNSTKEIREDRWSDLLDAYWESVTSVDLHPGFTRQECFDNLSKKFSSALRVLGFFLPTLVARIEVDMSDVTSKTTEEIVEWVNGVGGDEATRRLRDVADHMNRMGYLKKGVEWLESLG